MSGCAHMNRDELCAACALPKGREWKAKSLAAERHCAALEAELVELRAERDTLRAAHHDAAAQWQEEARLRREAQGEAARLREWNARLLSQATVAEEEARQAQAEVERLRAALREIEETTDGIPEQNCMIANRIARLALRGDTAPAEEKRGYAPTDALGDARAEAAEPRCVRCGSRYSPGGACSRSAEGCQGGRGEWTVCIPPACPHGHPPGSARDCACHEEKPC